MSATTGRPTLNIGCEASQNGKDWFKKNCYDTSTTTMIANFAEMSSYVWTFASSTCTQGGAAPLGNQSTCTRAFSLDTPTRYTRLVVTISSTTASQGLGGPADLWFELVPKKERN